MPVDTASPAEWSLARFCKTHCTADMDAGRFDGWWVKAGSPPTWDLIATCAIDGRPGLLIVEAKAHEGEIHRDGKLHPLEGLKGTPDERLRRGARSLINHGYIGRCIHEARDGLCRFVPSISIDRDSNYQLSNRIASAWKLADCGMPVVLLYLGFVGDEGMASEGEPLRDAGHWESVMHSRLLDVGAAELPETDIMLENSRVMRFRVGSLPARRQSVLGGGSPADTGSRG